MTKKIYLFYRFLNHNNMWPAVVCLTFPVAMIIFREGFWHRFRYVEIKYLYGFIAYSFLLIAAIGYLFLIVQIVRQLFKQEFWKAMLNFLYGFGLPYLFFASTDGWIDVVDILKRLI